MKLLTEWHIDHKGRSRKIELFQGDLSAIPKEEAVDCLVVSAFPDDYTPVRSSLIGALHRSGISVQRLALDKETDLRKEYSCWISRSLVGIANFKRLLCIESGWRGSPLQITDDVFKALAPMLASEFPNGSVAMPLIGAGNQGCRETDVLRSILKAATFWLQ